MKHGDVLRVNLPQGRGRVQSGTRPAILMQLDEGPQKSPTLVVVPLTSQLSAARFGPCVELEPTDGTGLRVTSIAMVYQIIAIDRAHVVEQIGALSVDQLAAVRAKVVAMISP